MDAGYKVNEVNFIHQYVVFVKDGTARKKETKKQIITPGQKTKITSLKITQEHAIYRRITTDTINVCGYEFSFLQELIPECDANGSIKIYQPQSNYHQNKPLNLHGSGAFCRFTIHAGTWPGVYLLVVDSEIIYIGETVNLARRFNTGYGVIAPINCYVGGQPTNCKMNKVVLKQARMGKYVKLYFYETEEYKRVELELLKEINTKYNVKDN